MFAKSNKVAELPKRETPKTDTEDPARAIDRKLKEDPRCKKSNTEAEDPHRTMPKVLTEDPRRAIARNEKVDPAWTES